MHITLRFPHWGGTRRTGRSINTAARAKTVPPDDADSDARASGAEDPGSILSEYMIRVVKNARLRLAMQANLNPSHGHQPARCTV